MQSVKFSTRRVLHESCDALNVAVLKQCYMRVQYSMEVGIRRIGLKEKRRTSACECCAVTAVLAAICAGGPWHGGLGKRVLRWPGRLPPPATCTVLCTPLDKLSCLSYVINQWSYIPRILKERTAARSAYHSSDLPDRGCSVSTFCTSIIPCRCLLGRI